MLAKQAEIVIASHNKDTTTFLRPCPGCKLIETGFVTISHDIAGDHEHIALWDGESLEVAVQVRHAGDPHGYRCFFV